MGYSTYFEGVINLERNLTEAEVEAFEALQLEWDNPQRYYNLGWTLQEHETELAAIDGRNYGFKDGIQVVIDQWAKPLGLTLTGRVYWEGEGSSDKGVIDVKDNVVRIIDAHVTYPWIGG